MVTKLFLLQFVLFVRYFVKLAQNDFRRSRATPQSFCWLSSSRTKSPKFRLKIVLKPSLYDIPEDEREARDAFRDHLTTLGVRKLQHSAGIHPFDCKNEIDFFVELLNIRKYVRFIVADSIDDEVYWKRKFNLDKYF